MMTTPAKLWWICQEWRLYESRHLCDKYLTLNEPITTKVVCFSRRLKCLKSLYCKQCGPRSDCSYRSSLFWVRAVCFYTSFVSNAKQLFAADDFSRRHFQMHFFLGALRVKSHVLTKINNWNQMKWTVYIYTYLPNIQGMGLFTHNFLSSYL